MGPGVRRDDSWGYGNPSTIMRALRLDIDRIQRLAGRHEQAISLLAAEADIGAGLGQANLTDARPVRRENLDAVIAIADPARADPDVAIDVDPQTIREARLAVEGHVDQRARVREFVAVQIVLPDNILGIGIVRDAGIANIDFLVVVAEGDAVRLEWFVGDLGDLAGLRIEPVHRLFLIRLVGAGIRPLSLVDADRAITGIGEPDRLVVGMNDHVVRSIERLAVGLLGEHGDRPIMFETDQPGALGSDLPAFEVEGVAVGFVGRFVKLFRDMAVLVEIAELAVIGNVAPDEILTLGVPGRPLGP